MKHAGAQQQSAGSAPETQVSIPAPRSIRFCRGCGCDDDHACVDALGRACAWVLLDIDTPTGVCSACAIAVSWDVRALATMGFGDEEAA